MRVRSIRHALGLIALGTTALGGCASSPETGSRDDALDAKPAPTRYHAFLANGECADVETATGTWTSRHLFPDAPESIRRSACSYAWTTEAEPDLSALKALGMVHLTPSRDSEDDLAPPATIAVPLEPTPGPIAPTAGAIGCDVCAVVDEGGHAFVILREQLRLHRIAVQLTDDRVVLLEIVPPGGPAQAFSVELPPTEEGVSYKAGPARMF